MMTTANTTTTTFHPWDRYHQAFAGGFYSNEPPRRINVRSGSDGIGVPARIQARSGSDGVSVRGRPDAVSLLLSPCWEGFATCRKSNKTDANRNAWVDARCGQSGELCGIFACR